jgi:cytochrome P450
MEAESYSHLAQAEAFEPTEGYRYLRERCPVYREEAHDPPFYVLSRFDDVRDALKAPTLWGNQDGPGVFHQQGGVLGSADDPDHARQRRGLLDTFLPHGRGDFIDTFAFPLPALVIGELLGVPPEDQDRFREWSSAIVAGLTGGDLAVYHAARQKMYDYTLAIVTRRGEMLDAGEALPDDVMTVMMHAHRAGELDVHEVQHLGHQLLVAGHETTTSLLGMMLYRLLERPALMARVRADTSLIPAVIEESLRFDSPVQGLFRTNLTACPVHDVELAERTKVQLLYAGANRDPKRFSNPDEFDVDREPNELRGHLAFGWGIHHCIGAALARLTARVAFERLLARTTAIELDGEARRNHSFVLHGLTRLPIRWT